MQVALIGLPLSGKTTLCNAISQHQIDAGGRQEMRRGVRTVVVDVPDPRVERLAMLFNPRKVTRAQVRLEDVSGVNREAAGRTGFGTEVLDAVGRCDALLKIVRAFDDPRVPHPQFTVDPLRDMGIVDLELILTDLAVVERRLDRIASQLAKTRGDAREALIREQSLMRRLVETLESEIPIRALGLTADEQGLIRGFQFLTAKPAMVVLNLDESGPDPSVAWVQQQRDALILGIRGALEMEIAQLAPQERLAYLNSYGIAEPGLHVLLRACYELLGLMSFFTVGEDEVRAWTVRQGATAVEAAAAIHSDLARGFIRAEVISYDEMIACSTLAEARRRGKLRLEGKDYAVQDGDILNIRFNV